ncbi:hypothetical protein AAC387_Pa02g4950 [Persea americana]
MLQIPATTSSSTTPSGTTPASTHIYPTHLSSPTPSDPPPPFSTPTQMSSSPGTSSSALSHQEILVSANLVVLFDGSSLPASVCSGTFLDPATVI